MYISLLLKMINGFPDQQKLWPAPLMSCNTVGKGYWPAGSIAISHYSPGSRANSCKSCRGYSPDRRVNSHFALFTRQPGYINSCKPRRGYSPDSWVNRHFVLRIQPTKACRPWRYWLNWCAFYFIYLFIYLFVSRNRAAARCRGEVLLFIFSGCVTRGLKSLPISKDIFPWKTAEFTPGGGGTHMLRHVCRPNGLLSHQKA